MTANNAAGWTRQQIVAEYNRIAAPMEAATELDDGEWLSLRAAVAADLIAFLSKFDASRPLFFENQSFPHRSDSIGEKIGYLRSYVAMGEIVAGKRAA